MLGIILPLDVAEEWRPVVGYEGRYEVSDKGRVKGVFRYRDGRVREHLLKCPFNSKGYLTVTLRKDGRKAVNHKVHRLVAKAFLGPCPPGVVVRHGLGGPGDASLSNLRYGTPLDNASDRVHHRRVLRSGNIDGLTDADVLEIHQKWAQGELPALLSEEYAAVMSHASKLIERRRRAGAPATHPVHSAQ